MNDDNNPPAYSGRDDLAALRAALFATLREVRAGTIDLDRARAVNVIAGTLIDSARVEVEYRRVVDDGGRSDFVDGKADAERLPNGITSVVRHRLRG